ncbi:hypothetical protein P12x_003907 [Tundrisphaera lichenicola]|uniref:hypothetical protein n=1 Tax=Tundrisphaera lichenicola TaxID=2029860 RepID=UPI003EB9B633
MNEITYVYLTAGIMVCTFAAHVLSRKFDPFAPIWLFFVGYLQLYVIQPISYHEWAISVRGADLVTTANLRAFWALSWFVTLYHLGPWSSFAKLLPSPPRQWSLPPIQFLCPVLVLWGLLCSGIVLRGSDDSTETTSPEAALMLSFPLVMLVAGVLLIVTGRQVSRPRPVYTAAGIGVVIAYLIIWMFNGKRSHSLVAVLVGVCSFYLPRFRRPSFPILVTTAMTGAMAVGISIGWRYYSNQHQTHGSFSKFIDFVSTFDPVTILESVNLKEHETKGDEVVSYETEEWGGYLLMLDTVPIKSEYDYGANYLRIFSTFIPRLVWPEKPIYGRAQWISAWMAGSEKERKENFTGPAIGILGATQLNGGSTATLIVLTIIAAFLGTTYRFYRLHADSPWAQAAWSLFYYNAWFMTVNDDPCNWFYYNFGFTTLPTLLLLWFVNKFGGSEPS